VPDLPAEHAQVLEQFGAWRLNDSFTTPVEKLQNALEQIVSLWEFPRASIQSVPNESKALLRSSVILYTLVGDGYRAVLYQPPARSTRTERAFDSHFTGSLGGADSAAAVTFFHARLHSSCSITPSAGKTPLDCAGPAATMYFR
jgi:hypothetical protein